MMFLPDGRVLIMDNELFKKTIDQSIVLDLLETDNSEHNSPSNEMEFLQPSQYQPQNSNLLGIQSHQSEMMEEEKQSLTGGAGGASRLYKDSNRKQSQANQKKRQPGDEQVNTSQAIDNTILNNPSIGAGSGGMNDGDQNMSSILQSNQA